MVTKDTGWSSGYVSILQHLQQSKPVWCWFRSSPLFSSHSSSQELIAFAGFLLLSVPERCCKHSIESTMPQNIHDRIFACCSR